MKFSIKSLGCKINQFDAGALRERLAAGGMTEAAGGEHADISVVFTCTVTKKSDYQCRQEIRRLIKDKPEGGTVVVTGCYAQTAADEIKAIPGVDLVVGNDKKDSLPEIILTSNLFPSPPAGEGRVGGIEIPPPLNPLPQGEGLEAGRGAGGEGECNCHPSGGWGPVRLKGLDSSLRWNDKFYFSAQAIGGRSRAFLKVQEGCESFCSYCIVPYARGKSRSAKAEDVLAQADRLIAQGYHEIVLTGVHLGMYGSDAADCHSRENGNPRSCRGAILLRPAGAMNRAPTKSLSGLVTALLARPGLGRLRLSSIEPMEIDEGLFGLFGHEKLCRHFHVPLQSGEAGVLASMGRGYTPGQYFSLIERIFKKIPDACIGADVIVGYPAEDRASFDETYRQIGDSPLNHLHVFSYSPRQGTKAFGLGDPVHGDEKKERSLRLRELAARKNMEFRQRFIGRKMTVVAEEKEDGFSGLTDNYIRVAFDGKGFSHKAPIPVTIEEVTNDICRGKLA